MRLTFNFMSSQFKDENVSKNLILNLLQNVILRKHKKEKRTGIDIASNFCDILLRIKLQFQVFAIDNYIFSSIFYSFKKDFFPSFFNI